MDKSGENCDTPNGVLNTALPRFLDPLFTHSSLTLAIWSASRM
jgi:hypothetical protein